MDEVWQSASGEYRVVLSMDFIQTIEAQTRAHLPNEYGTSVVGKYSDDGSTAEVLHLVPVSEDSLGTRFTFIRGISGIQRFLNTLFSDTQGQVHYIGEWHSHPGGIPCPSAIDDDSMFSIARDPTIVCPECILVIVGIVSNEINRGVYIYSRERGRIRLSRNNTQSRSATMTIVENTGVVSRLLTIIVRGSSQLWRLLRNMMFGRAN